MIRTWSGRLTAAALLVLVALAPVRAADPAGVLWETTSQMVMEGVPMAMPPQSMKLCAAKQWTRPPPGGDKSCVNSNYTVAGNKATWAMQCSGEMPMKGTGQITFDGPDSYTGAIKATAEGMSMTIKLTGKKIGACDNPVR